MMVIAGHNGAGKSTLFHQYFRDSLGQYLDEHIDPDAISKQMRDDCASSSGADSRPDMNFDLLAREEATVLRNRFLQQKISFSFETLLAERDAGKSEKISFIKRAVHEGYVVALLAVGLDSPQKSQERVDLRVSRGGHAVPARKILGRYPFVIGNIKVAAQIATVALIVDNSSVETTPGEGAYDAFMLYRGGKKIRQGNVPAWW